MYHVEDREIIGDGGTIVGLVKIIHDDEESVYCDCCRAYVFKSTLLSFDGSGQGLGDEIVICERCFDNFCVNDSRIEIMAHSRSPQKTIIIHVAHSCDVCNMFQKRVYAFDASGDVYDPLFVCESCMTMMYQSVSLAMFSELAIQ